MKPPSPMKFVSPEVFVAEAPIVSARREDVQFLKERVRDSGRGRTRLCAHVENSDRLHEMLIVMTRATFIRPSKHLGKEESMHVLEGEADFIFFDESGRIADVIPMGAHGSGRQFYCRTPENTYHCVVIRSELLAVHESTPGPFNKADTVFATWSPDESDAPAVRRYLQELDARIAEFRKGARP